MFSCNGRLVDFQSKLPERFNKNDGTGIIYRAWKRKAGELSGANWDKRQATVYVFVVLGIILVLFLDYIANKKIDIRSYFDKCPVGLRMAVYWCVCILIICILWDSTEMPQFIYNQF